jgi:signal transduction histidine kinase
MLQEQRLNISHDLHDNIGAQLTFIISSVENIKYAFDLKNTKLDYKLQNISTFTKSTILELRDTIWMMNHDAIVFEDLRARILNFIEKAKDATGTIYFNFTIDESLIRMKLRSIAGMNIYRSIQEAVNNTIKYSEADQIDIDVKKNDIKMWIQIKDNGIGFDISSTEKGNGLVNMEKRIEDIGGSYKLSSEVNKGTTITLLVNIQENMVL